MNKEQKVKSWLWKRRGNLSCPICQSKNSVIFGPYRDSLGYHYNYECINSNCRNPEQNDFSLARYNGYTGD